MKSLLKSVFGLIIICWLASGSLFTPPVKAAGTFAYGDVFVAVSNGQIQWRDKDGVLKQTLTTAASGYTTGMAFDAQGNLYATNFSGATVSKFDKSGNLLGTFGSGYNSSPESIVFDAAGNAYVGQADGERTIRKFDSSGNFQTAFKVTTEDRGTDWIDLADDQCTLYYTSEDYNILRYNVCTNTQFPNFNNSSLPARPAYALRVLSTGGVMVADTTAIIRLNTNGDQIQTYDAPGQDCWFALNLDPDAKSFWSADFCTGDVYKFDLATGSILKKFNSGTGANTVFGLTVKGEITAAQPCALSAIGDVNGNPIQQLTQQLRQVSYGGHEFNIPGKGKVFLPFKFGSDNSIARWGCYLISGVTAINYFATLQGVSLTTDPITLNDWMAHNLTNNNSGYASDAPLDDLGKVNWQNPTHVASAGVDPTTLIQYATAHGINMGIATNTSGKSKAHDDLLNQAMCDLNPTILGVNSNGHYVVASGKLKVRDTDTWRLHDSLAPAPTNLLDTYGNTYGAMVIFNGDKPRKALLLSLYSPAELVVTDPQGRRLGFDPRNGSTYEEIPSSDYGPQYLAADDGNPQIIERKVMFIDMPLEGNYGIEVIGTGNGQIGLDVVPIDSNGNGPRFNLTDTVVSGQANNYQMTYSDTPGQSLLLVPPSLIVPAQVNVQYSDPLNFTISANDPNNELGTLNFTEKVQPFNLTLTPNGDGTATVSGFADLAPGDYPVSFTVTNPGGLSDTKSVVITVSKEDARATYTGPTLISTANSKISKVTIPLRATIQDVTAVTTDPAYDQYPGVITNATVNFVDRENSNAVLCSSAVALIDSDTKTGTASCDWPVDIGKNDSVARTVGIQVNGYYTRDSSDDDTVIVVSKPDINFVAGGGFLINQNSGGKYAGDTGKKTDFAMMIRYIPHKPNLTGWMRLMVRQGGHLYIIKTTSLSSLVADPFYPKKPASGVAELLGKASIIDVTNWRKPVTLASGVSLQIDMKDNGEPGKTDTIAITLWDKSGTLLYSSNWDGVKTIPQVLGRGNLIVH